MSAFLITHWSCLLACFFSFSCLRSSAFIVAVAKHFCPMKAISPLAALTLLRSWEFWATASSRDILSTSETQVADQRGAPALCSGIWRERSQRIPKWFIREIPVLEMQNGYWKSWVPRSGHLSVSDKSLPSEGQPRGPLSGPTHQPLGQRSAGVVKEYQHQVVEGGWLSAERRLLV